MSKKQLNWNQRLALIEHYKPSDEKACSVFGVSQGELDTARQLQTSGSFPAITNMDFDAYSELFADSASATSIKKPTESTPSTSTPPLTATKRTSPPKKRGRKGDKIKNAFVAIPGTATPAETFATSHNVSLAVLRQSKRFDTNPELGDVRVKKVVQDDGNKVLCIWRESPTTKDQD